MLKYKGSEAYAYSKQKAGAYLLVDSLLRTKSLERSV